MRPDSKIPPDVAAGLAPTSEWSPTSEPNRTRVCDVIGDPRSWSDHLASGGVGPCDFQGATISDVIAVGNEVAVCTTGGACGNTFTVFTIVDADLRDRVVRALRLGLSVNEAAAEVI